MTDKQLPSDLRAIAARARAAVDEDPIHNLTPFFRALMYSLLGRVEDYRTRLARGRLAIATVEKALPLWEREVPSNTWPQQILVMAESLLKENTPREVGKHIAEAEFDKAAEWSITINEAEPPDVSLETQHVLLAAVECLYEAAGVYNFASLGIEPETREADIDYTSRDTASWAACAYVGPWYDPKSDKLKRQEFWYWWIDELIRVAMRRH